MTKVKVLGLFLALVTAMGTFAAPLGDSGVDISGSINAGIRVSGWEQEDGGSGGDMVIDAYSNELGDNDSGIGVDLKVKYDKENVGATVKLRARDNDGTIQPALFKIEQAFGYATLFDGLFKLTGGYHPDSIWNTGAASPGNWLDKSLTGNRGVHLEFFPIEGLSVGAALIDTNNILFAGPTARLIKDYAAGTTVTGKDKMLSPTEQLKFTTLGATYKADAFKFSVSTTFNAVSYGGLWDYETWSTLGGDGGDGFKDHSYFQAIAGVGFTGIDKITLGADFNFQTGSNKFGDDTYKQSDFAAALYGKVALSDAFFVDAFAVMETTSIDKGTQLDNGKLTIRVRPSIKINDVVSADFRVQVAMAAFENEDYKKGNSGTGDAADYTGSFALQLRPRLSFNFGNGVSFYTFYLLNSATASGNKDANDVKNAKNTHTVQFEFIYSF